MRRANLIGGLLLIYFGIIFLLTNFKVLGWDFYLTFLSFWPLFLIALGLWIIFHKLPVVQIIVLILILVIPLVYYLGVGPRYLFGDVKFGTYTWSEVKDVGIKTAKLKLEYGVGRINISATDKLVDLQANTAFGKPKISAEQFNEKANINIEQHYGFINFQLSSKHGESRSFQESLTLALNKDVVWDLELETGAIKAEIDLSEITFSKLDLDTGAGDVEIIIGEMGRRSSIDIDSGVGKITLVIPEDVGIKAKLDTGIGKKSLSGRDWQQKGDTYISENYERAFTKLDIELDQGVGKVEIISR